MLLEKINKLSNYYKELNKVKKIKNDVENYKDINSKLKDACKRFESIHIVYINLNVDDHFKRDTLIVNKPDFSSMLQITDQMINKISRSALITKIEADRIVTTLKEIEKPIREQWEKYATENFQNAIKLIEMIKPIIGDSNHFIILFDDLGSYKKRWPITEKEILSFKKKLSSCEDEVKKLDITPKVMDFLLKALRGSATINDLDQSIIDWAKLHNFSSKLEIKFRKYY